MDYSIDVGTNIFILVLIKFLLPLFIGLIIIGILYFLLKDVFKQLNWQTPQYNQSWAIVIACFIILVLLVTLVG